MEEEEDASSSEEDDSEPEIERPARGGWFEGWGGWNARGERERTIYEGVELVFRDGSWLALEAEFDVVLVPVRLVVLPQAGEVGEGCAREVAGEGSLRGECRLGLGLRVLRLERELGRVVLALSVQRMRFGDVDLAQLEPIQQLGWKLERIKRSSARHAPA